MNGFRSEWLWFWSLYGFRLCHNLVFLRQKKGEHEIFFFFLGKEDSKNQKQKQRWMYAWTVLNSSIKKVTNTKWGKKTFPARCSASFSQNAFIFTPSKFWTLKTSKPTKWFLDLSSCCSSMVWIIQSLLIILSLLYLASVALCQVTGML